MQTRRVCKFFSLLLSEGSACGLLTVTGSAALDVHMLCTALIIFVVNALHGFAVDGDGSGRMGKGACHGTSFFPEAFTTGLILSASMLAAHTDIALTAQTVLIIGTIFHSA
jgi:hypothetical protein